MKVETDTDVVGWGEGTGRFETDPNAMLTGKDVANIEGAIAALEAGGISKGPMSGIEMALWDAMGKGADLPVCKLLGGVVREEVDFCACMGLKAPSESAATAREYMDRWGFRFLKTKAGDDPQQGPADCRGNTSRCWRPSHTPPRCKQWVFPRRCRSHTAENERPRDSLF